MPEKNPLGLGMRNMLGGIELWLADQSGGNSGCPRSQHTWAALVHPSACWNEPTSELI